MSTLLKLKQNIMNKKTHQKGVIVEKKVSLTVDSLEDFAEGFSTIIGMCAGLEKPAIAILEYFTLTYDTEMGCITFTNELLESIGTQKIISSEDLRKGIEQLLEKELIILKENNTYQISPDNSWVNLRPDILGLKFSFELKVTTYKIEKK